MSWMIRKRWQRNKIVGWGGAEVTTVKDRQIRGETHKLYINRDDDQKTEKTYDGDPD